MRKEMKKVLALVFAAAVCVSAFGGCKKGVDEEEISVYMPDGAPALALAGMMAQDTKEDGVTYRVVDASTISSKVTYKDMDKNADFCVMPVTAASKLLGGGDSYKMLGAVTHGNLYLIGKDGTYTAENLSDLIGKTVGVLQINQVPGLTFKTVLNKYQIPWQEIQNDGGRVEDKVNLLAITGADAIGTELTKNADCFLVAEPAATAQAQKGYSIVGDLQALYGGGYTQAVLVAKKEFVEEKAEWTKEFVANVELSTEWLKTASGAEIVETVSAHMEDKNAATSLKASLLSTAVLERCGIYFTYASACKQATEEFLTEMLVVNDKAAAIPEQAFYWEYIK